MKRLCAALASGLLLLGLLPSTVSADRVSKGTDHYVFAGCDAPFDGGFASAFLEVSTEGEFQILGVNIWLDPAVPFETDPTASGSADVFDLVDDGTTIEAQGTFPTFDIDGNPAGDAELTITAARTGDTNIIGPDPGKTNVNSRTTGIEEFLAGSGTLTWDGSEIPLTECGGVVADVTFFQTNPRAFVSDNSGVQINCTWESETALAGFVATADGFGFFADAVLFTPELELFTAAEPSGSVTSSGVNATFELVDGSTGDPYTATASATFTPMGAPVTSTLSGASFRIRSTEQPLDPVGTIEYSTGDTYVIDDEHCDATTFDNHTTNSQPNGPKNAKPPANDGPGDAIALSVGDRFNTSNVGATPEPEFQLLNCPEGIFDSFGRTLWYSIEGTGGPITIDTAGSGIDTLIGVYVASDGGYEEVGCIDDVFFDPVGATYQAALTIDTEEGVTYYVQIGGYFDFFEDAAAAEAGRIRINVE